MKCSPWNNYQFPQMSKLGAGAATFIKCPHLHENNAFIQFEDDRISQPYMDEFHPKGVPYWMQIEYFERFLAMPRAYIRAGGDVQREFSLGRRTSEDENNDPCRYPPHLVEMRLAGNTYYSAERFKEFVPDVEYGEKLAMPPPNRIYIRVPNCPIYSAPLIPYDNPEDREREKEARELRRRANLMNQLQISSSSTFCASKKRRRSK